MSSWDKYWENNTGGEVFVSSEGQKNTELEELWRKFFHRKQNLIKKKTKVLDIASGAGSIFSSIDNSENFNLYALDGSGEALEKLKTQMPYVNVLKYKFDEYATKDIYYDIIVSQFGIEYSGKEYFRKIGELLSDEGSFKLIVHKSGSMIDKRTQQEIDCINLLNDTEFFDLAKKLIKLDNDNIEYKNVFEQFTSIEPLIFNNLSSYKNSILNQGYYGFRQLYSNQERYYKKDILTWLNNLEYEKDISYSRLLSMSKATINLQDINKIKHDLYSSGLRDVEVSDFNISRADGVLPLAWEISGNK
ncbi:hypothetical protein C1E23_01780 [Pseudoalteromonas phenolica]|uniref:Methyltransferase domain-containing protein n=1 Tax=Pseudoalteromonas phenolica TaxID=161398 RepID=A0A4Q7IT40_9GAMM|nr:class I SAM-dependent methyltransferase [Pseudoalteromonas phenolica]RZQ54766.1 hypothetical protein C1E23_01780 [Pseudoalteromonas phenolica]